MSCRVSFNILPVVKRFLTLIVPMCFCKIFLWSYPFFTIGTPDNLCLLLNMCPAFFLFFHGTRRASLIVALQSHHCMDKTGGKGRCQNKFAFLTILLFSLKKRFTFLAIPLSYFDVKNKTCLPHRLLRSALLNTCHIYHIKMTFHINIYGMWGFF